MVPPKTHRFASLPTKGRRVASPKEQGFSLIELLIVVAVIGIIAGIAIPNMLASRRAANEASAIANVRTLSSAEAAYRMSMGGGLYATMNELLAEQIVDPAIAAATTATTARNGYIFGIALSADRTTFCAGSAPISVNIGARNFSTDTPGIIYGHAINVGIPPTSVAGGVPIGQ